jgi:hypothetical protein
MSMKVTKYITPLLAGAAAAVAIAAAPTASAAAHQSCNGSGSGTVCQSRGNVQITAPLPQVQFHPYGDQAFALPPLSWCAGHVYRILVVGIELRRRGRGAVGRASHGCETGVSGLSRVMRRCCIRLPVVRRAPQPSRGASRCLTARGSRYI